jgi:hypothetical protein
MELKGVINCKNNILVNYMGFFLYLVKLYIKNNNYADLSRVFVLLIQKIK